MRNAAIALNCYKQCFRMALEMPQLPCHDEGVNFVKGSQSYDSQVVYLSNLEQLRQFESILREIQSSGRIFLLLWIGFSELETAFQSSFRGNASEVRLSSS
jgi:hypothetical protein